MVTNSKEIQMKVKEGTGRHIPLQKVRNIMKKDLKMSCRIVTGYDYDVNTPVRKVERSSFAKSIIDAVMGKKLLITIDESSIN